MDQGSTRKRSAVHNFAPTVTKFCVMWEGQALPHDTKFGNCRCEIVGTIVIFIWSLIHGLYWSGLIKAEPERGICGEYSEHRVSRQFLLVLAYIYLPHGTKHHQTASAPSKVYFVITMNPPFHVLFCVHKTIIVSITLFSFASQETTVYSIHEPHKFNYALTQPYRVPGSRNSRLYGVVYHVGGFSLSIQPIIVTS